MATFTHLFHTLEAAGITPFNLVLLIMVYFMGVKLQIFPNLLGKKSVPDGDENSVTLIDLHKQMKTLAGYFNHETTSQLQVIEQKQDQALMLISKVQQKQDEFDRFGILIRNTKTQ